MATIAKIIAIGDSAGIILPHEILDRLKLQIGDTICLADTPFGEFLTRCDEDLLRKLESTKRIQDKYRGALRKLAE